MGDGKATRGGSPPAPGSRWRRPAQLALALAVAAALYAGHSHLFGARLGELCDTVSECAWGGLGGYVCLQQHWGYCTRPCGPDRPCPASYRCATDHPQGPLCLLLDPGGGG